MRAASVGPYTTHQIRNATLPTIFLCLFKCFRSKSLGTRALSIVQQIFTGTGVSAMTQPKMSKPAGAIGIKNPTSAEIPRRMLLSSDVEMQRPLLRRLGLIEIPPISAVAKLALSALSIMLFAITLTGPLLGIPSLLPMGFFIFGFALWFGLKDFGLFVATMLVVRPLADVGGKAGPLIAVLVVTLGCIWILQQPAWRSLVIGSQVGRWAMFWFFALCLSTLGSDALANSLSSSVRILAVLIMTLVIALLRPRSGNRAVPIALGWIVLASSIIPVTIGLYQMIKGIGSLDQYTGLHRVESTFLHPSALADYLVMTFSAGCALITVSRGKKRAFIFCVLACTLLVIFGTYTRIAWIGSFAVALLLSWKHARHFSYVMFAAVIISAFTVPAISNRMADLVTTKKEDASFHGTSNSAEWRQTFWEHRIADFGKAPLTGIGLDSTLAKYQFSLHNGYLQILIEGGILTAFGACGLIVASRKAFRRCGQLLKGRPLDERFALTWLGVAGPVYLLLMVSENVLTLPTVGFLVAVPLGCVLRLDLHLSEEHSVV